MNTLDIKDIVTNFCIGVDTDLHWHICGVHPVTFGKTDKSCEGKENK